MTDDIVDCGGKYEVRPARFDVQWAVVNSETGVACLWFATKAQAVRMAKSLN